MESFIKIFRFPTLEVFTTTNNALVQLLRRTKIQVCVCMIFNDYNTALNILSLSTEIRKHVISSCDSEYNFLKEVRNKFV